MAEESLKKTERGPESKGTQPDIICEDDNSGVSYPHEQQKGLETAWKDKYVHLLADLENTRKRLARTSAQKVEAEKEALLRDILPVADGLDLALMHTPQDGDYRSLLQGIDLVRDILRKFFAQHDVSPINALGKPFDPRLHEAIGVLPNPKFPSNTVVKVERKGYLYGEKLLRPAQVVVTPSR